MKKLVTILHFQLCVNVIGLPIDFQLFEAPTFTQKSKYIP